MRLRAVLVAWTVLVCAAALSGCGLSGRSSAATGQVADAGSGGALSVVVGAHANAPAPGLSGLAAGARDQAAAQGARFSLVVADGAPFLAREVQLAGANADSASEGQRRANAEQVDDAVTAARARAPESDLLAALAIAADRVAQPSGLRTIVVQDSGLSTSGLVDFTQPGMFDADPAEVADSVADFDRLPNLHNVFVIFEGLGETAAPQQPLDPVRKSQLQQIWKAVAVRAGATDVRFDTGTGLKPPPAGLPPVRTVTPTPSISCSGDLLKLRGGPLAFLPASPDLIDPDEAVAALRPVADRIKSQQLVAEVFGTYSAVGDETRRQQLSEERAQTVANTLIGLGVPVSQLRVKGQSSNFTGYVPDRDARGRLLPAKSALNRFVTISYSKDGAAVGCS